MKFALALIVCAIIVQIWKRLASETQAKIIAKAKAMLQTARNVASAVKNKLFRRRQSYRHVFMTESGSMSPAGRVVLADLTKFCRGLTSTTVVSQVSGMVDPYASGLAEGRREVWLRIMKELGLDPMEVMQAVRDEDALAA
jgi:hypothetical protein